MIKKTILLLAAAAFSLSPAFAGCDGKCEEGDATKCEAGLAKLNLTDAQKSQIEALHAECAKESCSEAAHAKFTKGLEGILTSEQYAQLKSAKPQS